MRKITTTLTTTAEFSEDGNKRFTLTKTWDKEAPKLAIVMLAPSEASGIELDSTTMLVLNNASRLGYGTVSIVNLFATLGDLKEGFAEEEDKENLKYIELAAKAADVVIYAAGVGKATNKRFIRRQNQVLDVLKAYEGKLKCLANEEGNARFQHPLSPAVRTWHLSDMKVSELCDSENKNDDKKQAKIAEKSKKQA